MAPSIRGGIALVTLAVAVITAGCAHLVRSSVSNSGAQANGTSVAAALSRDGRYVVFVSAAANLVAGDTNAADDVFVRDHAANTTVRVSVADEETQGNGASGSPSVSVLVRQLSIHFENMTLPSSSVRRAISASGGCLLTLGFFGSKR